MVVGKNADPPNMSRFTVVGRNADPPNVSRFTAVGRNADPPMPTLLIYSLPFPKKSVFLRPFLAFLYSRIL
jgi:hypothetical protein